MNLLDNVKTVQHTRTAAKGRGRGRGGGGGGDDDGDDKPKAPHLVHIGWRPGRMFFPGRDLEREFTARWLQYNENHHNEGLWLLLTQHGEFWKEVGPVSQRDAMVAATLVQWLGTNCGFGFICEVFRACGLEVRDIKIEEKLRAVSEGR